MPRLTLSVILPNYNHAQYLPQSLQAIATQSRPPDEFIILDDGSTDHSLEVIGQYAARYPFLRVVRHEKNMGVVASVEDLMALATGDFLYAAAADDFVFPGFFEQTMSLAEAHPEAGVLQGKVVVVDQEGVERFAVGVATWHEPRYATSDEYLREVLWGTPNWHFLSHATLYRRAALREVGGFRRELGHISDSFAMLAVALKYGACYVPQRCAANRAMAQGFAASRGRDTERMLRLAETFSALMRSSEFRDRFPEDFVAGWRSNFERWVFDCYVLKSRERFGTSSWGRWRGRLLKQYLNLKVALLHRGDVVGYMTRHPAPKQPDRL